MRFHLQVTKQSRIFGELFAGTGQREISDGCAHVDGMTLRKIILACCVVMVSVGFDCSASKPQGNTTRSMPESAPQIPTLNQPIPPSHCRVIGTIVSVDSTQLHPQGTDPCSQAPCEAGVRVDSIVGYGSAFPQPFAGGQIVRVRFTCTLGPTGRIFPAMNPALPGLSAGDQFRADIVGTPAPGAANESMFTVESYEKR